MLMEWKPLNDDPDALGYYHHDFDFPLGTVTPYKTWDGRYYFGVTFDGKDKLCVNSQQARWHVEDLIEFLMEQPDWQERVKQSIPGGAIIDIDPNNTE